VHFIKKISLGLIFLVVTGLLLLLFAWFPALTDKIYTNGVFSIFRIIYDYTLGNLPFAFIYIVLPVLLYFLLKTIFISIKKEGFIGLGCFLFNFTSIFLSLFYLFWGFNYYANPVKDRLELNVKPLDGEYLKTELTQQYKLLLKKRLELSQDSLLHIPREKAMQENAIRVELEKLLSGLNYSVRGKVRVRPILSGVLMRLRTSGIYIPYVFEGHYDSSVHPLQWNNTIAHEMAHGYGVTDEGECNFLAYLVCKQSNDPFVQYSGAMSYYRYLARAVIRYNRGYYEEFRSTLDYRIISDLDQITLFLNRYEELMPQARDKIYDNYLKAHGVSEGIISYDRMIDLIAAYRESISAVEITK